MTLLIWDGIDLIASLTKVPGNIRAWVSNSVQIVLTWIDSEIDSYFPWFFDLDESEDKEKLRVLLYKTIDANKKARKSYLNQNYPSNLDELDKYIENENKWFNLIWLDLQSFFNYLIKYYDLIIEKNTDMFYILNLVRKIAVFTKYFPEASIFDYTPSEIIDMCSLALYADYFTTEDDFTDFIRYNWWFNVDISLWEYCDYECDHCSFSCWEDKEKVSFSQIEAIVEKLKSQKDKIWKISFLASWEFFNREDWYEILKLFCDNWFYNFFLVSRWPSDWKLEKIYKWLRDLKELYPSFNIKMDVSFDRYVKLKWKQDKDIYELRNNNAFGLVLMQYSLHYYIAEEELERDLNVYLKVFYDENNHLDTLKDFETFIKGVSLYLIREWYERENPSITVLNDRVICSFSSWFKLIWVLWHINWYWRWWNIVKLPNKDELKPNTIENRDWILCPQVLKNLNEIVIDTAWNIRTCASEDWQALKIKWKFFSYASIYDEDWLKKLIQAKISYFERFKDPKAIIKFIKAWRTWSTMCLSKSLSAQARKNN